MMLEFRMALPLGCGEWLAEGHKGASEVLIIFYFFTWVLFIWGKSITLYFDMCTFLYACYLYFNKNLT